MCVYQTGGFIFYTATWVPCNKPARREVNQGSSRYASSTLYKQPNGKKDKALELDVSFPIFIIISVMPYLEVGNVYEM